MDFLLNIEANHPSRSKGAEDLPSQKELADEMRVMTSADILTFIISKAKANEKLTVSSSNLK